MSCRALLIGAALVFAATPAIASGGRLEVQYETVGARVTWTYPQQVSGDFIRATAFVTATEDLTLTGVGHTRTQGERIPLNARPGQVGANGGRAIKFKPTSLHDIRLLRESLNAGKRPRATVDITATNALAVSETHTFRTRLER